MGIPIEIVPGLCTCAAAVKREGLVDNQGVLELQRSGLPFRTMDEVREAQTLFTQSLFVSMSIFSISCFHVSNLTLLHTAQKNVPGRHVLGATNRHTEFWPKFVSAGFCVVCAVRLCIYVCLLRQLPLYSASPSPAVNTYVCYRTARVCVYVSRPSDNLRVRNSTPSPIVSYHSLLLSREDLCEHALQPGSKAGVVLLTRVTTKLFV